MQLYCRNSPISTASPAESAALFKWHEARGHWEARMYGGRTRAAARRAARRAGWVFSRGDVLCSACAAERRSASRTKG